MQRWEGNGWSLEATERTFHVRAATLDLELDGADIARCGLVLHRRWWRWCLRSAGGRDVPLRGLSRAEAAAIRSALVRLALLPELDAAVAWKVTVDDLLRYHRHEQRWIPRSAVELLAERRPQPGLDERIRTAGCQERLTDEERDAVDLVDGSLSELILQANEQITLAELLDRKAFFDTIERTPLTEEQARAVICLDDRVQLLAAAGSGKTSVMVARAAYVVHRGWIEPNRILLLAFNRNAAMELQQRIEDRFAAAGIDATGIRASTFHSFGLEAIGRATGRKPRLAPWLEQGREAAVLLEIVDELRDASPSFRYRWDLYRTLFAAAPTDLEADEPDGWDADRRRAGYRTFAGEVVKSHGERLIANFLFLNGVRYAYEHPYAVDVADAQHVQYRPDFHYPEVDLWHEHWALDANGEPPPSFRGYREAMTWKRQLHARHGTTLIETTWAEVVFGDGLSRLGEALEAHGLELDWNPDRPVDRFAPVLRHEDLARTIRTFMAHVKSNGLSRQAIEARIASHPGLGGYRTRLFLDVYWEIHEAWERRLAAADSIDFEDMLVRAAEAIEGGAEAPFDLVLIDELQDASRARARLVQAIVRRPGSHLLAVGDDWQAINRFAGADLGVMTDFADWFGPGPQLALTATFRCPQRLSDVARRFVTTNPRQFDKPMRSATGRLGPPVRIVRTSDPRATIRSELRELAARRAAEELAADHPRGQPQPVRVTVLGRYRFDRDLVPDEGFGGLDVQFLTVHGSKGLEADHIIVANLGTGTYGFPSTIADDPVLQLAMPTPEPFPHAEERRLLYVALTRARHSVTLLAPIDRMSPFAVELAADPDVLVDGEAGDVEICERCGNGTMVARSGPYGRFLGCSTFPACRHTQKLA